MSEALTVVDKRPSYDLTPQTENKPKTKFIALNDRVLIRCLNRKDENEAKWLADEYQRVLPIGEVITAGEYHYLGGTVIPIVLSPGTIVHYNEYCVEDIILNGEKLLLCRYGDLKGIEVQE